MQFAKNTSKIS